VTFSWFGNYLVGIWFEGVGKTHGEEMNNYVSNIFGQYQRNHSRATLFFLYLNYMDKLRHNYGGLRNSHTKRVTDLNYLLPRHFEIKSKTQLIFLIEHPIKWK
jgi:hypothetical protein